MPSYRGPDRRAAAGAAPVPRSRLAAGALAGAVCAVTVDAAVLAARAQDPWQHVAQDLGQDPAPVVALAAVTGSAPLLLSAVLLLTAWRVGGRAPAAHWGAAAATAGGAGPAVAGLVSVVAHPAAAPAAVTASLVAAVAVAAVQCRAALRAEPVQTDVRPSLAVLGGASLVLAAGAAAAAAAGAGWPAWTPLSVLAAPVGWWLLAVLGAVSGAALVGALEALRGALRRQHLRGMAAVADLHRRAREAADVALRHHDARSALAAVRAATDVLAGDRLRDPELADSVRAELVRVERLLGGTGTGDPGPGAGARRPGVVDLREAAAPVVTTWRARGLDVTGPVGGGPALALGDVDAVRRVLANLLANAERHAPGAPVRLVLHAAADGRVVMTVRDDGPGVPADAREAVFAAGARGHHDTPGEGLGLASARALAEADGGSLRLLDAPGGACFELRLPAAAPVSGPVGGPVGGPVVSPVVVGAVVGPVVGLPAGAVRG